MVWAADTQKRALASVMGVAGKPTTTTPIFLFNMARENALCADDEQLFGLSSLWVLNKLYTHTFTNKCTTAKLSNVLEQLAVSTLV